MTSRGTAGQGRVGTLLAGTWRIEHRLGAGGMATVYAAQHHRNGGWVAVKVLHPHESRDRTLVRRFLREGYLANTVNHRGVPRVYDDGVTDDGCAYLIMDRLEGETLEALRVARGGRLAVDEALTVIHHVLQILAAAHDRGIAHRDVKPDNVFLTGEGQVKLLDFGIAGMARSMASSMQTGSGVGWGTPLFMAPEQLTGASACGPRVDVWAVGVMFFTLVSGGDLFKVKTLTELMAAHQAPRALLDSLVPGIPGRVARVFERALRCDADERYADARAMACALEEAESDAARFSTTVALATVPRIELERARAVPERTLVVSGSAAWPAYAPAPSPVSVALAQAPRRAPPPTIFDRRRAVIGLLLVSIATFVSSAVYSVRVNAESPSTAAAAAK